MRQSRAVLLAGGTLLMAALLLVSGCASFENEGSPPDTGSQSPDQNLPGPDDTPRDDLRNEHVVEWQRYEVVDDSTLRVFFTAGSETCYGTRSIIEETDAVVRIATVEGEIPEAPEVCTLVGREASLVIETTKPIGEREVVSLPEPELR